MARTTAERAGHPRGGGSGLVGADDFAREQVVEIQRARILSGMFDVVYERGVGNVCVADVVERSGVSRRTFYELFTDRERCFLAAFDEAVRYASGRVLCAYEAGGGWRERIRAALTELLSFLDDEPVIGHLLVAESLAGGPRALERRSSVLAQIVVEIEQGGEEARTGSVPAPPLSGEGLVGGVLSVIHTRITQAGHEPLLGLVNPLMSMIVAPYLGPAAARVELARPVSTPTSRRGGAVLLSDPFKDAGMRLTYRTVRVLMTIADSPRVSNRAVGEGAGVSDQGQISKLLGRLQRIGLISNTGLGPRQGVPNAWSLTATGRQVAHSIRTHTDSTNDMRAA